MPTIRDVAHHAQVSVTTVSHVINNTRFVEPETEQRVRTAIEVLGYRPNLLARGLRRRQTRTIGLLIPDNSNPFFADVARAIEDTGFSEEYSVILCNSDMSDVKQAAYIDLLLSKQVDGLILISSGDRQEPLRRILDADVPVVVVDRELDDLPVDQILVDNEQGGYLAGRYLVDLGHRLIGCIMGPSDVRPSAGRVAGFRRALEEAGLSLPDDRIVRGDGRYSSGEQAMQELLSRNLGITALFAFNDLMAVGALSTLRRAGVQVPDYISIIGFDGILHAATTVPAITTIAQPVTEIGRVSVCMLLDRIARRQQSSTRVLLPTTLVERESCRKLAADN